MIVKDYQTWLAAQGGDLTIDGACGGETKAATLAVFANPYAPGITDEQFHQLALEADCTDEQLQSVANVESSGSGYDSDHRPKMLFERHKFSGFTGHKYDTCSYSNPSAGGYNEDSWGKLTDALCKDIDAAFKSASWGKFQVMGYWFPNIGFCSPLEAAWACVRSELGHYRLFVGYIRLAGLLPALREVSTDPNDCRPFASGYNGPSYAEGGYHEKIAEQMRQLT